MASSPRAAYDPRCRNRTKKPIPEPEPEQFALVGPGEREPNRSGPSDEALDSVGRLLCRMFEERQPGMKWRYDRGELLVPEGMMFLLCARSASEDVGRESRKPRSTNTTRIPTLDISRACRA